MEVENVGIGNTNSTGVNIAKTTTSTSNKRKGY